MTCRCRMRGSVLIVAMWTIVALTGLVLTTTFAMRTEAIAGANRVAQAQAQAAERGMEQLLLMAVEEEKSAPGSLKDLPLEARQVGECLVWVVRPDWENEGEQTYGMTDEAGKIDLNTADRDMLLMLPGMTEDVADAIMDWRDADSEPRAQGAEDEYYLSLPSPYRCKNGPLESADELLLVKGVTRELLYGYDRNRNGLVEDRESQNQGPAAAINSAADTGVGISPFVTTYGLQASGAAGGGVDVNQVGTSRGNTSSAEKLKSAMTQNGLSSSRADELVRKTQAELRTRPFTSVFDYYYRVAMSADELQKMYLKLSVGSTATTQAAVRRGKVNLNTAPRQVLRCLPNLDENDVAAIISHRQTNTDPDTSNLWWLVNALSQTKLRGIADWVTGSSVCYSADIVALSPNGRAFRRTRVVINAQSSSAKIVYRRDLTMSGWPLPREIRSMVRSGQDYQTPMQAVGHGGSSL